MVAKITRPTTIRKAVHYNEHKVKQGMANCIAAGNFLKETDSLTLPDKMQRFERLNALNRRVGKNTLHISLNFDPSERLSTETLSEIAAEYMDRIGFGDQPYLVYEHRDAAHPHIHIVTTTIPPNGKPIDINFIGRNQSEQARKAIEEKYKLVRAEAHKREYKEQIRPLNAQKIQYGKSETRSGITNVLDAVLNIYKYSSLPELNAILSLYNVRADRGEPGTRIHNHHGLVYRILDKNANPVGVPIKASSIYSKPTLAFLQKKFKTHNQKNSSDLKRIKSVIDWIMLSPPRNLEELIKELQREQIHTVIRRNQNGLIYGLTFVDSLNKTVFNGSDLGKEYTAKRLLESLGFDQFLKKLPPKSVRPQSPTPQSHDPYAPPSPEHPGDSLLDILLRPEDDNEQTPYELRVDKKKKKNPPQTL